jgi:WD40 repeat protein/tetratricopeptide (TPR) repeat protein
MLLHQVLHEEPRPPRKVNDKIPRDLETICLKAMAKAPARRYPSARELAEDLRRFLTGEPIRARPVGQFERLGRWCRRNPFLAVASSLTGLALVAATAASILFALTKIEALTESQEHQRQLDLEKGETQKALGETKDKLSQLEQTDKSRRGVLKQAAELALERGLQQCADGEVGEGMLWLGTSLEMAPPDAPELQRAIRANLSAWRPSLHGLKAILTPVGLNAVAFSPDGHTVLTGGNEACFWDASSGRLIATLTRSSVGAVAFTPDGRRALTGETNNTARAWDLATGKPIGPPLALDARATAFACSPDGHTVAVTIFHNKTVRLWDVATGNPVGTPLLHGGEVQFASFSPDGRTVLTGCASNGACDLQQWDAASGKRIGSPVHLATWGYNITPSPDGRRILTGGYGGVAPRLWDATGKSISQLFAYPNGARLAAFSPDGQKALTGADDMMVHLWNGATGQPIGLPLQHENAVAAAVLSPDGRTVLTGTVGGVARLWDAGIGRRIGGRFLHQGQIGTVAFSPDGAILLTAGTEGTCRIWEARPAKPRLAPFVHEGSVNVVAFSPNHRLLATGGADKTARVWEAATGKPVATLSHERYVAKLAFCPDGRTLLAVSGWDTVSSWETASGKPISVLRTRGRVDAVAFSPDGREVATLGNGVVHLWEVASGKNIGTLFGNATAVSFTPDGRRILVGAKGKVQVWDARTHQEIASFTLGKNHREVAFNPDGSQVLTYPDWDADVQLWDAATGKLMATLPETRYGPGGITRSSTAQTVVFSPDGKIVLTNSQNRITRLWSTATGKLIATLAYQSPLETVAFSPDGSVVLTGSRDKTARLWDTATGKPVGPPFTHQAAVRAVAFSPDGHSVVTGSEDGTAQLWDVPLPREGGTEDVVRWTQVVTGMELDALGFCQPLDEPTWKERRERSQNADQSPSPSREDSSAWDMRQVEEAQHQRQWLRAVYLLSRMLDRETAKGPIYLRRASVYGELGQWERAVEDYSQAIAANIPGPDAWQDRARAYLRVGRLKEALADFTKATELAPGDGPLWLSRCLTHAQLGEMDSAAKAYKHAAELSGVIWVKTEDWRALAENGGKRKGKGPLLPDGLGWQQGVAECTRAIEGGTQDSWWRCGRALAHAALGEWEQAAEDFTAATERNPDCAEAWQGLARAYFFLRKEDALEKACAKALVLNPKDWSSWSLQYYTDLRRYYGKEKKGSLEQSIGDLTKAIELGEPGWGALAMRGHLHACLEKWEKAAADFARASQVPGADDIATYWHALLALKLGDPQGYRVACTAQIKRVLQTKEIKYDVVGRLACVLAPYPGADLDSLLPLLERNALEYPNNSEYLSAWGQVLYRVGQWEAAVRKLNEAEAAAARLKPTQPPLRVRQPPPKNWLFLAMAHSRLGHREDAKKWLEKFIEEFQPNTFREADWSRRLEYQILQAEAESLVNGKKP